MIGYVFTSLKVEALWYFEIAKPILFITVP